MEPQSTPLKVVEQPPAPRRPTGRPVPQTSPEHLHLSLDALRAYRTALTAEEHQVSYWRRIVQARLDVVQAGSALDSAHLRGVLVGARHTTGRTALLEVLPVDDLPPMPDLAQLWDRRAVTTDGPARRALTADLEQAEAQLSHYRSTLHARIGAATAELIARYRESPGLCLCALPLTSEQRSAPV